VAQQFIEGSKRTDFRDLQSIVFSKTENVVVIRLMKKSLFKTGVIGSVIVALCCFTPILVVLFVALGLSALIGYLDYVLFPLLGIFLVLIVVSLVINRDKAT
jgi:mercuric ion transport protein